MVITEERLRELGQQYLNRTGYEELDTRLVESDLEGAKLIILGMLDRLWSEEKLNNNEARLLYQELGVPLERASRIRQAENKF